MGNNNSNTSLEKLNKIFVDKYADYVELMQIAGCTNEEIAPKANCIVEFDNMSEYDKAIVVRNDLNFLDFFTGGGIVNTDSSGKKLYEGINKGVALSIICTMSSIKNNVEFPKEYLDELESKDSLPKIKDMISHDMSELFPDMKKMFFLGAKDEFNNKMMKAFKDEEKLELLSDIVDASVFHSSEAGIYQYMGIMDNAIETIKKMNVEQKKHTL